MILWSSDRHLDAVDLVWAVWIAKYALYHKIITGRLVVSRFLYNPACKFIRLYKDTPRVNVKVICISCGNYNNKKIVILDFRNWIQKAKTLHNYSRQAQGTQLFYRSVRSSGQDLFLTVKHSVPLRDSPTAQIFILRFFPEIQDLEIIPTTWQDHQECEVFHCFLQPWMLDMTGQQAFWFVSMTLRVILKLSPA